MNSSLEKERVTVQSFAGLKLFMVLEICRVSVTRNVAVFADVDVAQGRISRQGLSLQAILVEKQENGKARGFAERKPGDKTLGVTRVGGRVI